jgi:hypothetical protein
LDNDKRYDAFVNVGGLDGLRGNAFKVEQTFNGIYLQWWGHHGGGIYPQLTRQRDEFYPHLYGDYPYPWIFY